MKSDEEHPTATERETSTDKTKHRKLSAVVSKLTSPVCRQVAGLVSWKHEGTSERLRSSAFRGGLIKKVSPPPPSISRRSIHLPSFHSLFEKNSLSLTLNLSVPLSHSQSLSLNVSFYIALLLRCFLYVLIWEKETVKSLGEGEGEKKINLSNYFYEGTFGKKVGQSLVELSRFIHHRNCGFSGELFYYLISTKNRGKAAVEIWNFQAQEEIGHIFFYFFFSFKKL